MEQLGKYILSVTAAAAVTGILSGLSDPKSGIGALLKLIGGLFLAFTVISPVAKLDFESLTAFAESYSSEAAAAAAVGENIRSDAVADIIKSRLEAYILDKAGMYQAELTVEVVLSQEDESVPEGVTLRGSVSPYVKGQLQRMIEEDLGIPKENQEWIE